VDGVGQGTLLVLIGLADVEHDGGRVGGQSGLGAGGVDLADRGLGGGQQVTEGGHVCRSSERGFRRVNPTAQVDIPVYTTSRGSTSLIGALITASAMAS
jgi:hypothetical protein